MHEDVLVLAEQKGAELDSITHELLTKGRVLADEKGGTLAVLIVGHDTTSLQKELAETCADKVLACDSPLLKAYNTEIFVNVMSGVIRTVDPGWVLLGYTYFGIEIGTVLASKTNRDMLSNCIDLTWSENTLTAVRPVFGGTVMARVELNVTGTYFVSFEKGALPKETRKCDAAPIESMDVRVDESTLRTSVLEVIKEVAGKIDITQANIIVSVGRGIGDKDKIGIAQDLADALGGVLARSRPVADMGWLPVQQQVGISANYVTPTVYIACGISGASQHVAAMRDSGTIIAINKDPNAPIFRVADYGVVGDLFDIVPALIEEARG